MCSVKGTTEVPKLKKSRPILDRAEWDFTACPEVELKACRQYEFAREVSWLKDIFFKERPAWKTLGRESTSAASILVLPMAIPERANVSNCANTSFGIRSPLRK